MIENLRIPALRNSLEMMHAGSGFTFKIFGEQGKLVPLGLVAGIFVP